LQLPNLKSAHFAKIELTSQIAKQILELVN